MECCQQRPFCFEQMWMTNSGCSDTIEAVWRNGEADPRFVKLLNKVDRCGIELTKWSKKSLGSVRVELKKKKLLRQAKRRAIQGATQCGWEHWREGSTGLMDKEAKMWAQWAHVAWLKDGDWNTKFFTEKLCKGEEEIILMGSMTTVSGGAHKNKSSLILWLVSISHFSPQLIWIVLMRCWTRNHTWWLWIWMPNWQTHLQQSRWKWLWKKWYCWKHPDLTTCHHYFTKANGLLLVQMSLKRSSTI